MTETSYTCTGGERIRNVTLSTTQYTNCHRREIKIMAQHTIFLTDTLPTAMLSTDADITTQQQKHRPHDRKLVVSLRMINPVYSIVFLFLVPIKIPYTCLFNMFIFPVFCRVLATLSLTTV